MSTLLFLGLLPLILFAIINYYANLKQGVIASIFMATGLAVFSKFYFDYLDFELLIMVVLLIVLGLWSIRRNNELYFKLQPALTGLISVAILAWYQLFEVPFAVKMLSQIASALPPAHLEFLTSTSGSELLSRISLYSMVWLFLHSLLVAWAARYRSTSLWLTVKALFLPYYLITVCASEVCYLSYMRP